MLMYSKINYFLSANSTLHGQEGISYMYMYTNSQEDNATSTLMRIWSLNMKVLMKFPITEMWTPDYTAQNYLTKIENRVNLIKIRSFDPLP